MGTQGALVHTTQGGIRYIAYYDRPHFHRAEAIKTDVQLSIVAESQDRSTFTEMEHPRRRARAWQRQQAQLGVIKVGRHGAEKQPEEEGCA